MLIEETVRCIREEGFSAASARHIIERAGVSWGVIQHHFGDRDGLLTAVIDDAVERLVSSLEALSKPEHAPDTEALIRGTWEAFANPHAMAGMEILMATKELRRGLDAVQVERLGAALVGLIERVDVDGDSERAATVGMLLWTTPVAMMIAEMFAEQPLAVNEAQGAVARLIDRYPSTNGRATRQGPSR